MEPDSLWSIFPSKSLIFSGYQRESLEELAKVNKEKNGVNFFEIVAQNNIGLPKDILLIIFKEFDLRMLFDIAKTCKKAKEFFNNERVNEILVNAQVKSIIMHYNNFAFSEIGPDINSHMPDDPHIHRPFILERKHPSSLDWPAIENLCAAGSLGDGDALLLLAEMDWNHGIPNGKKFKRYGYYRQALECKIPGTERKWFSPNQDQYCAIFLGIANDAMNINNNPEKKKIEKLERTVGALICINDALYFNCDNTACDVANKLWLGDYDRSELAENNSRVQRARTLAEKERDFKLISKLQRHAKSLGLDACLHGNHFHQLKSVLGDEAQTNLYIQKGRAAWMPK